MNKIPNSLQASDAESEVPEPAPEAAEPGSVGGTEEGMELDGHTLLSRPEVPQGRRSLFRR